jgi:hypothetical protein
MRAVYRSLTATKKYEIWDGRLSSSLNSGYWNVEQKKFIQSFQSLLSKRCFEDLDYFQKEVEPKFVALIEQTVGEEVFTKRDAFFLLTTLEYESLLKKLDQDRGADGPEPPVYQYDCNCSLRGINFWCEGIHNEDCQEDECDEIGGCGMFFNHKCNGCCTIGGLSGCS